MSDDLEKARVGKHVRRLEDLLRSARLNLSEDDYLLFVLTGWAEFLDIRAQLSGGGNG